MEMKKDLEEWRNSKCKGDEKSKKVEKEEKHNKDERRVEKLAEEIEKENKRLNIVITGLQEGMRGDKKN